MKKNNVIVHKLTIAKTFEQRDVYLIKILKKQANPGVFIVGGEDGTDWTSSAVIAELINRLNEDRIELLDLFNFYLVPILNPDGFNHSHEQVYS